MGAILAAAVPIGRRREPGLAAGRRPPAQALADGAVIDLERGGELARQQRARKREEPGARAKSGTELAAELRRGHRLAVRNEIRAVGIQATDDRVGQVADVDQAPAVVDGGERQRPAAIDRAQEREEIRLYAGSVDERRPKDREAQAGDGA